MRTPMILLLAVGVGCSYALPFDFEGIKTYERTDVGNKIDKASVKMLKTAFSEAEDKNLVMSPLGVLMLLHLYTANLKEGGIRNEVMQLLGEPSWDTASRTYTRLAENYENCCDGAIVEATLNLQNKLYVSDKYKIDNTYRFIAQTLKGRIQEINFGDIKAAAETINTWAERATNGHIKNAVTEDKLDPATAVALFNVIFFQGKWHVPFNASETEEKVFHVDGKTTVKKPMMKLKMPLFYGENKKLEARFVELPYKGPDFRMVITLPDKVDGLPNVLEKMTGKGILDDVFALSTSYSEVELELPRFEIAAEWDLKGILSKLGVSKIFSEENASIVDKQGVVVSKAFQKAFVKVDEEGATAGAFTGMIAVPTSSNYKPPPPIQFKVDRPFAFFILQKDTILFTGTYSH